MTYLIYILSFLVLISIIVFIHELGHFTFARLFGVRVIDFSIGFGRSIKSWQTNSETIFNLRILPVGGFVQMKGENISNDENEQDSFASKKYYQKMLITLGGPLFNFFLALVIFFMINLFGVQKVTPLIGDVIPNSLAETNGLLAKDLILEIDGNDISSYSDAQSILSKRLGDTGIVNFKILRNENTFFYNLEITDWLSEDEPSNLVYSLGIVPPIEPVIGEVLPDSPAAEGGLNSGDMILKINANPIYDWSEIKKFINEKGGEIISLTIDRNGESKQLFVKPIFSEISSTWQIGISSAYILNPSSRKIIKFGIAQSLQNSFLQTFSVIENSLIFFKKIIFGQISSKNLGGPVMIGQYAGESVIYGGLYSFIYLIAFISISLGIVNLFPLPVLDGGQALILTIERIIGKNLPDKLLDFFYKLGTLFLLFLFVFVFLNDIFRIIL
ncbi:MAG: putative zinc metalloprotease [Gammaproteobacteria bacterium]|nr:MAG: putative zinc metalloprotease [Gammaproteobacteria bacterium]